MIFFNSFETARNWLNRAEYDHSGSDNKLGDIYRNCHGDQLRLVKDDFMACYFLYSEKRTKLLHHA